jgi:biopolymer transport protein ExbD
MQFRQVTALNITAPEIETAGKNKIDEQVVLAVDAEGAFFLNDQRLEAEALDAALRVAGEVTPDIPVLLMADEEAPLKHVTEVMDLCRKNRLNKIRLQSR